VYEEKRSRLNFSKAEVNPVFYRYVRSQGKEEVILPPTKYIQISAQSNKHARFPRGNFEYCNNGKFLSKISHFLFGEKETKYKSSVNILSLYSYEVLQFAFLFSLFRYQFHNAVVVTRMLGAANWQRRLKFLFLLVERQEI
jgi:hypothetical protein